VRLAGGDDQHVARFEPPRRALFHARAAAHIERERREIMRDRPAAATIAGTSRVTGAVAATVTVRRSIDENRSEPSWAIVEVNAGGSLDSASLVGGALASDAFASGRSLGDALHAISGGRRSP
jgi:hypothetical protein